MNKVSRTINESSFSIETGRLARQASGAVLITHGDTVVLCTATSESEPRLGVNFLPLSVNYIEKHYASGRIPGGFLRREARPGDHEVLISRFIDRPIRPLFPNKYRFETQIIATVMSTDHDNDPGMASITGASCALLLSDIPFSTPLAGIRVVRKDGELIGHPTLEQIDGADINLVIAATKDALLMVEGGGNEVSEAEIVEALEFGHKNILPLIEMQEELVSQCGKPKRQFVPEEPDQELVNLVKQKVDSELRSILETADKKMRKAALSELSNKIKEEINVEDDNPHFSSVFNQAVKDGMRNDVVKNNMRIGQRKTDQVRDISCSINTLPKAHGSSLFTRGETQALVAVTLGSKDDEQLIDNLHGVNFQDFMFHYNFPPYSVGEASMLRGVSRREIGHGFLARRAIIPVLPNKKDFPYTIRIVSEILESNGSSSMASVCGASMSLMNSGAPLKNAVAGIAMGLIKEGDDTAILSDISGDEDHLGDMDFKVAGTKEGITAIQMDIKIDGLSSDILEQALEQARVGRLHILDKMDEVISDNSEIAVNAPRLRVIRIKTDKIGAVIGAGGKVIKSITERYGCRINIADSGEVTIMGTSTEAIDQSEKTILTISDGVSIGDVYQGTVTKVADYGLFVELMPGISGLLHKSNINDVDDFKTELPEGSEITVKIIGQDRFGKIKLDSVSN